MNETILIALTGFGIAFFHAAIPTHWLPFVITARAQRWNRHKALSVTALAGTGHVLFTAFLGVLIAWFGIALHQRIGSWFPWIAGGALMLFGLFYVYRQLTGHGHSHMFGGHAHGKTPHFHTHSNKHDHSVTGPHGGKVIDTGHGLVEIAITEDTNAGRLTIYSINSHGQKTALLPSANTAVETIRHDQTRQLFTFQDGDGSRLVSIDTVAKPYQFTTVLTLLHGDHKHSYETRFSGPGEDETQGETIDIVTSPGRVSDRVAITSLLALLTFSPCESFLPVYVSGIRYGWMGFLLLTAILSFGTVAGMVLFTWLTLTKLEKLNLRFLEKYENGVIGGLLCTLGLLIILIEK